MKAFIFVGLIIWFSQGFAGVIIRADNASVQSYDNFLKAHPEHRSYSQTAALRLQGDSQVEQKLYQLSDSKVRSMTSFAKAIRELQKEYLFSPWAWGFVSDFVQSKKDLISTTEDQKAAKELLCHSDFFQNQEMESTCFTITLPLSKIKERWPMFDQVLIGGRKSGLDESIQVPGGIPLQWTLLSDSHREIQFFGRFDDLLQQDWQAQALIQGSCQEFTTDNLPLELKMTAQIYFSEECLRPVTELPQEKSWLKQNWKWVVPVGIVATGIIAYSLKDKTLVFNLQK